jgi:hypothetical protein
LARAGVGLAPLFDFAILRTPAERREAFQGNKAL